MKYLVLVSMFCLLLSGSVFAQTITNENQIAAAVSAAPEEFRAGARVLGYNDAGEMVVLREGTNAMICLADEPGNDQFKVACYHESMEPYMARGRELRAEGMGRDDVTRIRDEEARSGKIKLPEVPATLYNLVGEADAFDYTTGKVRSARTWYVLYVPFATEESTGLSTTPITQGAPWIMFPGEPGAHIMVTSGDIRTDE